MKALVFDGTRLSLAERPDPRPLPGEVVVTMRRAGICTTDLEIAKGYMGFKGVLGHELLGTVDGKRVAAEINFSCGTCESCRANDKNHCPKRTVMGILGHDGALAEKIAVPKMALHAVPDRVSDDAAAFAEPLAAALHVLDDLQPKRGEKVTVIGDGKLGILVALALAKTPAKVTLVGHHREHLDLVRRNSVNGILEKDVTRKPDQDAVVEATGSPEGLALALELVRPRGSVVLKSTYAGAPPVALAPVVIHEIRVIGSRCGSIDRALEALEEGLVDPVPLLARTYPLSKGEEAFAKAREPGVLKVAVVSEAIGR